MLNLAENQKGLLVEFDCKPKAVQAKISCKLKGAARQKLIPAVIKCKQIVTKKNARLVESRSPHVCVCVCVFVCVLFPSKVV